MQVDFIILFVCFSVQQLKIPSIKFNLHFQKCAFETYWLGFCCYLRIKIPITSLQLQWAMPQRKLIVSKDTSLQNPYQITSSSLSMHVFMYYLFACSSFLYVLSSSVGHVVQLTFNSTTEFHFSHSHLFLIETMLQNIFSS